MSVATRLADGVLELRLNRPGRLNALTLAMTAELLAAVQEADRDEAVRVILLSGEGRAFCAGKDRDDPAGSEFVALLQALAKALMNCRKPVVVAVQGWAVGAGLELMLNCDLALAARSARFMLPEIQVGLFGTGAVTSLLPRHIGLARAKGALMLGREFSASQAEQWGLLWSAVEDDQLHTQALALAQQLAGSDPAILGSIKALLHQEVIGDVSSALEREARVHQTLMGRPAQAS
ncbi:MAG: enoyl-CoA hydratase/isomerase family protein [Burkholderiaceae bacterium]